MPPVIHLLLLCVFLSFPFAVLTEADSFSLPVSKNKAAASHRDFVRDWAAAHQKWGNGVSPHVASKFALADTDGQIRVEAIGTDDLYVAEIGLGSPAQKLKLALDTGSADFWVQSTDTHYYVNDKGPYPPQYKPKASNSSTLVRDAQWDVSYVDGTTAQGIIYQDTISLGPYLISNATIQSAETVAYEFEKLPGLTGIMGLAKSLRPSIQPLMPSVLDMLRDQLPRPVFAADMRRNSTGVFRFGGLIEGVASDDLTWLDTDPSSPYWDVSFSLTAWDGGVTSSNITSSGDSDNTTGGDESHARVWWQHNFTATVDTGTTLLFLPDVLASMYWQSVPGVRTDDDLGGAYTFPCSVGVNLPDLLFKLPGPRGHILTIPGAYLNYGPAKGGDNNTCWGGLQGSDELGTSILGDVMLKALLVVFDMEGHRVGFANKFLDDVPAGNGTLASRLVGWKGE